MIGQIVCSKAGRDKGKFMVIVAEDDDYVYVCDGKERPLKRPKRKNRKHLAFCKKILEPECFKTNKLLRKFLAIYTDGEEL
ncbi:MAG: RNA-binding protein [Acutalibacteraceae bacterium]|jgi:ribosomal protein L14E/L6E/L27E